MLSYSTRKLKFLYNPSPNQSRISNTLRLGNSLNRFNLFEIEGHQNGFPSALEEWLGDFFQLVFKIA